MAKRITKIEMRLRADIDMFNRMRLPEMSIRAKALDKIGVRELQYQLRLWRRIISQTNAGSAANRAATQYLKDTESETRAQKAKEGPSWTQ